MGTGRLIFIDGMKEAGTEEVWKEAHPDWTHIVLTSPFDREKSNKQWNEEIFSRLEEGKGVVALGSPAGFLSRITGFSCLPPDIWRTLRNVAQLCQSPASYTLLLLLDPLLAKDRNPDADREELDREWRDFNLLGAFLPRSQTLDMGKTPVEEALKTLDAGLGACVK